MNHNAVAVVLAVSILGCTDRQGPPAIREPRSPAEKGVGQRQVVKITPAAVAELLEAQRKSGGKTYLRVALVSGGTTGFRYDLKFDDTLDRDNDYLDDRDGIKVVVDKRSALFLEGATIDWQTMPDGREGFQLDNRNAIK